jgi:hypothetical protein
MNLTMQIKNLKVIMMVLVIIGIFQFFFWYKIIHSYAFHLGLRTAEVIGMSTEPTQDIETNSIEPLECIDPNNAKDW